MVHVSLEICILLLLSFLKDVVFSFRNITYMADYLGVS